MQQYSHSQVQGVSTYQNSTYHSTITLYTMIRSLKLFAITIVAATALVVFVSSLSLLPCVDAADSYSYCRNSPSSAELRSIAVSTLFIQHHHTHHDEQSKSPIISPSATTRRDKSTSSTPFTVPRGGFFKIIPGGYNPFGYKVTKLGLKFLDFEGSLDSDVGRFLTSIRARKRLADIKAQWLEIVRASKTGQSMRIYRTLDDLIGFCLQAGLLD